MSPRNLTGTSRDGDILVEGLTSFAARPGTPRFLGGAALLFAEARKAVITTSARGLASIEGVVGRVEARVVELDQRLDDLFEAAEAAEAARAAIAESDR